MAVFYFDGEACRTPHVETTVGTHESENIAWSVPNSRSLQHMQSAIAPHTPIGPRVLEVFFYGLYMDAEVLSSRGVVPRAPRRAFIEGHSVRLGSKAVLLRAAGKRAYGMLFRLTHDEIDVLYEHTSGYVAEPFVAVPIAESAFAAPVAAISMVHRELPDNWQGGRDTDYAGRWLALTQRLGIPVEPASSSI